MAREKDKYLQVRITESLRQKAKEIAASEGQSMSDWIRDLIKREVWRREMKGHP